MTTEAISRQEFLESEVSGWQELIDDLECKYADTHRSLEAARKAENDLAEMCREAKRERFGVKKQLVLAKARVVSQTQTNYSFCSDYFPCDVTLIVSAFAEPSISKWQHVETFSTPASWFYLYDDCATVVDSHNKILSSGSIRNRIVTMDFDFAPNFTVYGVGNGWFVFLHVSYAKFTLIPPKPHDDLSQHPLHGVDVPYDGWCCFADRHALYWLQESWLQAFVFATKTWQTLEIKSRFSMVRSIDESRCCVLNHDDETCRMCVYEFSVSLPIYDWPITIMTTQVLDIAAWNEFVFVLSRTALLVYDLRGRLIQYHDINMPDPISIRANDSAIVVLSKTALFFAQ